MPGQIVCSRQSSLPSLFELPGRDPNVPKRIYYSCACAGGGMQISLSSRLGGCPVPRCCISRGINPQQFGGKRAPKEPKDTLRFGDSRTLRAAHLPPQPCGWSTPLMSHSKAHNHGCCHHWGTELWVQQILRHSEKCTQWPSPTCTRELGLQINLKSLTTRCFLYQQLLSVLAMQPPTDRVCYSS